MPKNQWGDMEMNVGELIEALKQFPPELPVFSCGIDACWEAADGPVSGVEMKQDRETKQPFIYVKAEP